MKRARPFRSQYSFPERVLALLAIWGILASSPVPMLPAAHAANGTWANTTDGYSASWTNQFTYWINRFNSQPTTPRPGAATVPNNFLLNKTSLNSARTTGWPTPVWPTPVWPAASVPRVSPVGVGSQPVNTGAALGGWPVPQNGATPVPLVSSQNRGTGNQSVSIRPATVPLPVLQSAASTVPLVPLSTPASSGSYNPYDPSWGAVTGGWSVGGNWITGSGGTIPPVSHTDTELVFTNNTTATYISSNNIQNDFLLNKITLSNANTSVAQVLTGMSISFINNSSLVAPVVTNTGAGAFTIFNNLALSNTTTFASTFLTSTTTVNGVISGTGGLTKDGGGMLTLGTNNTYTGATTVNAGTLQINTAGAISNASVVTVNAGATFATKQATNSNTFVLNGGTLLAASPGSVPASSYSGGSYSLVNGYNIYTFTTVATNSLVLGGAVNGASILVVGGGGGGGNALGGGGGAGAVVYITNATLNGTYSVTVGGGGAGGTGVYSGSAAFGKDGTNSTFGTSLVIAAGGGGGGKLVVGFGRTGGSGGGAGAANTGESPVPTGGGTNSVSSLGGFTGTIFGNKGGSITVTRSGTDTSARGGGGAGTAGSDGTAAATPGGAGGDGKLITDSSFGSYSGLYWGGGGGGGAYDNVTGGAGGLGGGGGGGGHYSGSGSAAGGTGGLTLGGTGGTGISGVGGAGGANTGSGGGGATWNNLGTTGNGGAGGSGIIIVSWLNGIVLTLNGTIDLQATSTLDDGGSGINVMGAITNVGGLTKAGLGTISLYASNTFSGGLTINAGMLQIAGAGQLGSGTYAAPITNNANFVYNSSVAQILSGSITNSGTVMQQGSGALTVSGAISGTGLVVQAGSGTMTLSGPNTYTGGTMLNAGWLAVSNNAALGANGSTLTFNGGTLQAAANLTLGNSTITLNSGTTGTVDTVGNALTLTGIIGGAGTLTKVGAGTLTLTGSNNFTGAVAINAGTLAVSSSTNLGSGTALTITNGAALLITNVSAWGAPSSRAITFAGGVGTNVIDVGGGSTGSFSNLNASTIWQKNGGGTLIFSNVAFSTINTTIVNGGSLVISNYTGSFLTNTAAMYINSGGTLVTTNAPVFTGSSVTGFVGATTVGGIWNLGGAALNIGTNASANNNQLTISGVTLTNLPGLYIGRSDSSNNRLVLTNAGAVFVPSVVVTGANNQIQFNSGTLTVTGVITNNNGALFVVGDGVNTATLNLATSGLTNSFAQGLAITNQSWLTGFGVVSGGITNYGTVLATNGNLVLLDRVSGTGTNRAVTGGTLTLYGANNYSGRFELNDGTLVVTNGTGLGQNSSLAFLAGGGTLQFNIGGTATGIWNGVADFTTGTGNFQKTGTGTLLLTNTAAQNLYQWTGATLVNGGTLVFNGSLTNAGGAFTLAGGTLGGTGWINRAVIISSGGTISPGNSPGTIVVSNLTWEGGGTYLWQGSNMAVSSSSLAGINWDLIRVTNNVTINATAANPGTLTLESWTAANAPGTPGAGFPTAAGTYDYLILTTAAGGISANATNGGIVVNLDKWLDPALGVFNFYIDAGNTNLFLRYTGFSNYSWKTNQTGSWDAPGGGNWIEGFVPPSTASAAIWFTNSTSAFVSTVNTASSDVSAFKIGTIVVSNSASGVLVGTNILFSLAGTGIDQRGAGAFLIGNNLVFSNNVVFGGSGSGQITVTGAVSGVGQLTKRGPWNLVLAGSNAAYSGSILLNSGTLTFSNAMDYTLGTTSLSGTGTLVKAGSGTLTLANANLSLSGAAGTLGISNGTLLISGVSTVNVYSTTIGAGSALVFSNYGSAGSYLTNASGQSLNVSGTLQVVGGTNRFDLVGAGLNLQGRATASVVNAVLNLNGQALNLGATGTNLVQVSGGTLTNLSLSAISGNYNTLLVTNGGQLFAAMPTLSGSSNTLTIAGTNALTGARSLWDLGGQNLTNGSSAVNGNVVRVGDGGTLRNGTLVLSAMTTTNYLQWDNGASGGLGISLAGGGQSFLTNVIQYGLAASPTSMIVVGSANAVWDAGGQALTVGEFSGENGRAGSNLLVIAGGIVMTNFGQFALGRAVEGGQEGKTTNVSNTVRVEGAGTVLGFTNGTIGGAFAYNNGGSHTAFSSNQVLLVSAGGTLLSSNLTVGVVGGQSGEHVFSRNNQVVLNNATWTNWQALVVGQTGVSGDETASENRVVVTNGATFYNGGLLTVGSGTFASGNQFIVGGASTATVANIVVGNNNSVNLLGGQLTVTGYFSNNNLAAVFQIGDGVQSATLNLTNRTATHTFTNGIVIAPNATLLAQGTITAAGATGLTLTNGGTLRIGVSSAGLDSVGSLTLNGGFNWLGGGTNVLSITDFGSTPGVGWDYLNINGAFTNSLSGGGNYVLALDSLGAAASGFNSNLDYTIKFAGFTGVPGGFNAGNFTVSKAAFNNGAPGQFTVVQDASGMYLLYAGVALSADFIWTNQVSASWGVSNAWKLTPMNIPTNPSATMVLQFNGTNNISYTATNDWNGTAFQTGNFSGLYTNNKIVFASTSTGTNTLMGSTLVIAGTNFPGFYQTQSGMFIVSNSVTLATNMYFRGSGGGTVVMASNITGNGTATKLGGWNLILQGSNTFTGAVLVDSAGGTLTLANAYGIGTNSLAVSNGTVVGSVLYTLGNGWSNQAVLISGAGSYWTNSAALTLGAGAARSNSFTVTGSGSLAVNGAIVVGSNGAAFNSLVVTNGSRTFATGASTVGFNASSNSALVTGSGSFWSNAVGVTVGAGAATGNVLTIDNSGTLFVNGGMTVGTNGGLANSLVITNGGRLIATGPSTIGFNASSNTAVVSGSGAFWSNATVTVGAGAATGNVLTVINSGSLLINGGLVVGTNGGFANSFVLTNGGRFLALGASTVGFGASSNTVFLADNVTWNLTNTTLTVGSGVATGNVLTIGSGALLTNGSIAVGGTVGNAVTLNAGGTATVNAVTLSTAGGQFNFNGGILSPLVSSATFMSGSGTGVVQSGGAILNVGVSNATISVTLTNGGGSDGGLLKLGSGTLTLTGANSYNGLTTISNGTLVVNNLTGSGTGSGFVNVLSNATLAGFGTIAGTVTNLAGGIIAPGDNGIGTLNVGTLTLASGSKLNFNFFSIFSNDLINVTATNGLTLTGGALTLTTVAGGTFDTPGLYNLIGYTTNFTGSIGNLSVANTNSTRDYLFGTNNSFVNLTIIGKIGWVARGEFLFSISNNFWSVGTNWFDGTVPSSYSVLTFGGNGGLVNTNDLAPNTIFAGLVFSNNAGAFTLNPLGPTNAINLVKATAGVDSIYNGNTNGNTETINIPLNLFQTTPTGLFSINATSGAIVLNGAIGETNGSYGIVKTGTNSLTLAGTNTYSGGTVISNGTLIIANTGGSGTGSGSVLVVNGTTLTMQGGTINGAAGASVTNLGTVGGYGLISNLVVNVGTIDLTNGTLIFGQSIDTTNGTINVRSNAVAQFGTTFELVQTNTGTINLSGGALTGSGLYNSNLLVSVGGGLISNRVINATSGFILATNATLVMTPELQNFGVVSNSAAIIVSNLAAGTLGSVSNANLIQMAGGTLTAGSITNTGSILGFGTVTGTVVNSGFIFASNGTLHASVNTFTNPATSTIGTKGTNATLDVTVLGGPAQPLINLGTINMAGGTLLINAGNSVSISKPNGVIIGVGNIQQTVFNSNGTIMAANPVSGLSVFSVGLDEFNYGTLGASNNATLNVVISGSSFNNNGTISMLGGTLMISNLTSIITNNLLVSGFGTVTPAIVNLSASSILASNGILTFGLFNDANDGTLSNFTSATTLNVTNSLVVNNGQIVLNGGLLTLVPNGGLITNASGGAVYGPGAIANSLVNATGGSIYATNGVLNLATNASAFFNNQGFIVVATNGTLNVTNAWNNTNGLVTLQGGYVTGGTVTNKGQVTGFGALVSMLVNAGEGLLTVSNGTLVLSNAPVQVGTFVVTNGGTLNVQQTWNNAGTVRMSDGTIIGQTITNTSIITGFGTITPLLVNTNSGTVYVTGGTLTLDLAPLQLGTLVVSNAGTLDIRQDWNNRGVLSLRGGTVIDGILTNTSAISGFGTITSLVVNATNGIVTASGGILTLDQAPTQLGKFVISNLSTLDVQQAWNNSGTLSLLGGTLVGGNLTNQSGGRIDGFGTISSPALINSRTGMATTLSQVLHITSALVYNQTNGVFGANNGNLIVDSVFTNAGTVSFVHSTGSTFKASVVNQGAWLSQNSTALAFNGDYTVGTNGYISMAAGDVYSFKSNFFNASSQSNQYNTLNGKFVFEGDGNAGQTQVFGVAGINFEGKYTTYPGQTQNEIYWTNVFGEVFSTNSFTFFGYDNLAGYSNNFALGNLTIGSSNSSMIVTSTLELVDSFGLLFPDDGHVAALYLDTLTINPGSLLIISNNVELFFKYTNGVNDIAYGTNAWSANTSILLLPGSSFHQIAVVPEPSVLLLMLVGGAGIYFRRRRSRVGKSLVKP